jgi:arylsulfatase A-like enzyme
MIIVNLNTLNRNTLNRAVIFVCFGVFIILNSSCSNKISKISSVASNKPNIIFILADDLGYGDVGIFGQQKIKTPNIDRLARNGMRFTQFYSGTSVCAPSRSSFMTGQHTGHTPIRGNRAVNPEGQWPLPENVITVAEVLKSAGYSTGNFGKWGLGYIETTGDPLRQGFDRFYGYNCQAQAHNYFPLHLWDNDQKIILGNTYSNQSQYAGDMIQEKALQFLGDNSQRPFFLFLSYTLPHAGLQLPQGDTLFESYKKQFNESPVAIPTGWDGNGYQPQAYPLAAYAAMVGKLDSYVGEIINKIKQLGVDKNTLVVFASDNGPHKEGGNDPDFFNSSGGLRGIKRDLYEGGIRIPFIASWPGAIKARSVSNYVGAFWDLLPTFAQLAGVPAPQNIDGVSIVPTLLGKAGQKQHEYLYWEFHEKGGRQAIRMGKWKAIKYEATENPDNAIELYDLEKDVYEKNNLASQHPDIISKVKNIFLQAHVESADFPFIKKAGPEK